MLERFYRINEAAGISIHIADDGRLRFAVCSVSINNTEITIDKKRESVATADELKEILPANTYVGLNLNGRGVFYKQIEKTETVDSLNFSKVLPNANPDDFYIQNFVSGSYSFMAVIRKTEADKRITELRAIGFIPLMLSLGPFPVEHVIAQLNFYDPTIIFDGYTIARSGQGDWESCSFDNAATANFPIKIESEAIHERLIVPYASAFQLVLSNQLTPIQTQCETVDSSLKKVLQERRLKVQGVVAITAVFILLLVNFVVYSLLNSTNGRLVEQVSRSAQSNEDIQKISDEVAKKQALLNVLGWEDNMRKSSLIDQVASLLPPELTWKEASIDPIDLEMSRKQKIVAFSTRKIKITGTSEKIISVNEWIARVKTKPWVKNVTMDSYSFNSELNTGQFTVIIDY